MECLWNIQSWIWQRTAHIHTQHTHTRSYGIWTKFRTVYQLKINTTMETGDGQRQQWDSYPNKKMCYYYYSTGKRITIAFVPIHWNYRNICMFTAANSQPNVVNVFRWKCIFGIEHWNLKLFFMRAMHIYSRECCVLAFCIDLHTEYILNSKQFQ